MQVMIPGPTSNSGEFEVGGTSAEGICPEKFFIPNENQRITKGQQLKGKIGSALFRTFPHFFALFQHFSPRAFLKIRAFFFF